MATCGYLCPACEGKGVLEDGSECDWCNVKVSATKKSNTSEAELEEWIEKVHQGPCCSDTDTKDDTRF